MFIQIILILIGLSLLAIGADILIKGSSNFAKRFYIPEILIGLTIVSIGTSMPEFIITIKSSLNGASDLIIGNVVGSNICNILLILGIMAILAPMKIDNEIKKIHIPITFIASILILMMAFGIVGSQEYAINAIDGTILIILFIIYFSYPIISKINNIVKAFKEKKDKNMKKQNLLISLLYIIIGIILLKYGGDLVVNSATNIAKIYNVSQRVIGLSIIAIGTSLPELVTSVVSIIRKDTDLAIGNLFGSCIINIFLILGTGGIIRTIEFSPQIIFNIILLIISIFLIWIFTFIYGNNTITRKQGVILLTIFAIYMINLF